MNILVTGGSGFIGKNLISCLQRSGHTVYEHKQETGDITKKGILEKYIGNGIQYVFHLAARTFVPASWDDTYEYFNTNVMGTVEVLEFCRKQKCPVVLMSTYVYGEPDFLPVTEEHKITAPSPYHQTKIIDEILGEFYAEQFQFPVTVFRPFNVYGYGQNEEFLLPKIMKQILDDDVTQIEVMDLTPKRDYVYIKDVIQALCAALKIKDGYHVYNIGFGSSVSVEDVIKTCLEITGKRKSYRTLNKIRANEILDCVADISKIKAELEFQPEYNLYYGVKDWYEELILKEL